MNEHTRKDTTPGQNLAHSPLLIPSCLPPSFPGVRPDPPS